MNTRTLANGEIHFQEHPSPTYRWGIGSMMSSTSHVHVEKWWPTKKAAAAHARTLFLRNPVLVRWHADGEIISR